MEFFFCLFPFLWSPSIQAQVRCTEIYTHSWASALITQTLPPAIKRLEIEDLTIQEVQNLLGLPFQMVELSAGKEHPIQSVVLHSLRDFSPPFQNVLQKLLGASLRPSWLLRGTDNSLNLEFEAQAQRMGVTGKEVREVYELDAETFAGMWKKEKEFVEDVGLELGQFLIEFKDGTFAKSNFFTDFMVENIAEYSHVLEPFLQGLANKPIKAVHVLHTHPALYPGSAGAISFGDISVLGQIRLDVLHFLPRQDIEGIDFHIYAVARSDRQILVGHYSERGLGFE